MDPGYFDIERKQNPKEQANIFSKLCFWYTRQVFVKGRKGQLSISDVYRCTPGHRAAPRGDQLGVKWKKQLEKKQDKEKKPSLLLAIIQVYGLKFIIGNLIFTTIDATIRLSIPMCLEGLINYFSPSHGGVPAKHAYLYALGVVGFMAISAAMIHPMLLWLLEMAMKIRVSCCSLIYRKLLRLDLTAGGKASEGLAGHVVNLLTTDAQRFDMASLFMTDLIRTPIESTLIVYLMYRQIGVATLVGVAFLLMFIPLQGYLGKITSKLRRKTAMRTDNRIRLMNEVIQSIEAIKMYAWEFAFARIIGKARKKEMSVIKKTSWLRAVMISCVKLNTKVAILLSIISYISLDNELTAAKVFVIFSYYEILKYSLVDFLPLAITFTLEAYVSVKRIQEFLLLPEVDNQDGVDLVTIDEKTPPKNRVFEKIGNGQQAYIKSETNLEHLKPQTLIDMKDYTAYWRNVDDEKVDGKIPALVGINLVVKPESLTTVVGTVGSGKSTLLQAMLKELTPNSGHLHTNAAIAYAAQEPWLFEASVRQNILFGQDMDLRRYKQVIKCCQLKTDLEILPHGDKTIVGERGASLSGGQRARISLARCVYQNAEVYLLDDPLAAVDAKVAQAIYEECIRHFLRDKATVLVTHHVQYAKHAQNVCVMRGGKIVAQGTYHELKNGVAEFEKLIEMGTKVEEEKQKQKTTAYENQESVEHSYSKLRSQRSMSEASQLSFNLDLECTDPKYEGESQKKGSVDNSVYVAYIRSGGSTLSMMLLIVLFLLAQLFYSSTDIWLKEWVNLEEANSAAVIAQKNNTAPEDTPSDMNNEIISNTEPQAVAGPSRKRTRSSSSSSTTSSSSSGSSSSCSKKRGKKSRHSRRKKGKRARNSNRMDKLFKEVSELRNLFMNQNVNSQDAVSICSAVSGELYANPDICEQSFNEQSQIFSPEFTFNIETKLKEPAVPKTSEPYIKMLLDVQRLGTSAWSEVRYADTQKLYNHTPGFVELETNDEIKTYDTLRHLVYADKTFAALTYCILKQKESLQDSIRNLLCWAKDTNVNLDNLSDKVVELFQKGDYNKISSDLLQMVCGHRAECIEMRREAITSKIKEPLVKTALNKIPPSSGYIFEPVAFTNTLEKAGGVRKAFWPIKAENVTEIKLRTSNRRFSREQGVQRTSGPSRGTHYNSQEPGVPVQLRTKNNPPSRGGYYLNTSNDHNYRRSFHNRGSRPDRGCNRGRSNSQRGSKVTKQIRGINNDSYQFQAGQLTYFQSQWKEMGAPNIIMKLIQGYYIPFIKKPPLALPDLIKNPFQTPVSNEMSVIIDKMKKQGILTVVQRSPSFISPLFLVPKPDGSARPIFNLKPLNSYVKTEPFHLINMYRIPNFLQPRDWLCKVDLSQAYFHLKIAKSHRCFLRLIYQQELLEMTCLPFGLSTAPKTFSILTNWVAQMLRERWNLRIVVYLDDYLIVHQNPVVLRDQTKLTVEILQKLGWQINFDKSVLVPQKNIHYLGIVWNPWDNTKSLPKEKVSLIIKKTMDVLERQKITLKGLQKIIGLLNFASFVIPRGRLNHRQLMRFMGSLPVLSTKLFQLPQNVCNELTWWVQNCQTSTPLHYPPPVHFLTTDASDQAWGAQLDNVALSGAWSLEERTLHCNQKELLAILHALQSQAHILRNSSILIQCDNRTAVTYLRKEGGTKSLPLVQITYQILHLLDQHQIHFSIHHIPGKYNNHADHLSRFRKTPEWHLRPASVKMVFAKWGTPMIDLFASDTAHVVYNYVSRDLKDHQALFHDAFSVPWNYPLAWVFPPPFLIPKVLTHLNQSTGIFLIVVPRWKKVFWRADLKARSLTAPLTLKNLQKHLVDTSTGLPPPQVENLVLEVWKCGGGLKR